MKKILIVAAVFSIFCSQLSICHAQMQALFSYSTFYVTGQDMPYVETYLSFDAWTMQFAKSNDGAYHATAEVLIVLKKADSVCYFKKYDLNSPSVVEPKELNFNFIDVQRFSLKNGIYNLELTLRDKNTDAQPSVLTEKVAINYDRTHASLSSLQMMSSIKPTEKENILSRGGYDMEPYVSDFYPEQVQQIQFYYEAYNMDRELGKKPFLAIAYVEQQETGTRYEGSMVVARKHSAANVPVFGAVDIAELPSGNYNLVVELRNSDNQLLLYKKMPFFRSNPGVKGKALTDFAATFAGVYTDEEQLNTYLDALRPIASDRERSVVKDLLSRPGIEEKQAFLYNFWRDRYPMNAESEWLKYKERVDHVQAVFSYPHTPGIHTDRGRVYLQYGPPDFIRDEKNYVSVNKAVRTTAGTGNALQTKARDGENSFTVEGQGHIYYLPYQLWRYNKLPTDDPDRVFLFWDEHRSGYYKLLNSNARGEVQDPGWERRLCRGQLDDNAVGEVGEQFNRGY